MLNKKSVLVMAALGCMAFATSAFAAESLHRDSAGQLHYVPLKASQTVMTASDIDKNGNWIVPGEVLAMQGKVVDVNLSDNGPVIPLRDLYATTNPEVASMNDLEFQQWLDKFVGAGGDADQE